MVEHTSIHIPYPDIECSQEDTPHCTINFYLSPEMAEKVRNNELDAAEVLRANLDLLVATNPKLHSIYQYDRHNIPPNDVPYDQKRMLVQLCVAPPEPIREPENWWDAGKDPELVEKYCPADAEILHLEVLPQSTLYESKKFEPFYENWPFFNKRHLIDPHMRIRASYGPFATDHRYGGYRNRVIDKSDRLFFNWMHTIRSDYNSGSETDSRCVWAIQRMIDSGINPYDLLPSRRNSDSPKSLSSLESALMRTGIDLERHYAQQIWEEATTPDIEERTPEGHYISKSQFPAEFFSTLRYAREEALKHGWSNPMEMDETVMMPHHFFKYDFISKDRVGVAALLTSLRERNDPHLMPNWDLFEKALPPELFTPKGGTLKVYLSPEMVEKIQSGKVTGYEVARAQYIVASRLSSHSRFMKYNHSATNVELYASELSHTSVADADVLHSNPSELKKYRNARMPEDSPLIGSFPVSHAGPLDDMVCFENSEAFDPGACGKFIAPEQVSVEDSVFYSWLDLHRSPIVDWDKTKNLKHLLDLGLDCYADKTWLKRSVVSDLTKEEERATLAGISLKRYYRGTKQNEDAYFSDVFWDQVQTFANMLETNPEKFGKAPLHTFLTPSLVSALDTKGELGPIMDNISLDALSEEEMLHLRTLLNMCPAGKDYSHIAADIDRRMMHETLEEPQWTLPAETIEHEGNQAPNNGQEKHER